MSPFQRFIGAIAAATVIGAAIGVPVYIGQQGGGGGGAGPGACASPSAGNACLFVAAGGSPTCARSSTPVAFGAALSGGNVCGSFTIANTKAQNGDTVLVEAGSYPNQNIVYTANRTVADNSCYITPTGLFYAEQSVTSGCVTFEPDAGATVNVDGAFIGTSGIQLEGMNFTNPGATTRSEQIGVSVAWMNTPIGSQCKTVPQPHDDIVTGSRMFVTGTPNSTNEPLAQFNTQGVYNVAFTNNDIGPVYSNQATWQHGNLDPTATNCVGKPNGPGIHTLYDWHIYIGHSTYHDLLMTYSGPHIAGIHFRASDSWIIGNKFTDIAQQDLEIQTDAGASTGNAPNIANDVVVGNIFGHACAGQTSPPCSVVSGGSLTLTATGSTDSLTNDVVGFNDIDGSITLNNDQQGGGAQNLTPYPGTILVGNIFASLLYTDVGFSVGYCPPDGSFSLNASTSASLCGTDYHISGYPYTNNASPTFDYTLDGTPDVSNKVPTSTTIGSVTAFCPATDYAGSARPRSGNALCANGALEP